MQSIVFFYAIKGGERLFEANADRSIHGIGSIIVGSLVISIMSVAMPEVVQLGVTFLKNKLNTAVA